MSREGEATAVMHILSAVAGIRYHPITGGVRAAWCACGEDGMHLHGDGADSDEAVVRLLEASRGRTVISPTGRAFRYVRGARGRERWERERGSSPPPEWSAEPQAKKVLADLYSLVKGAS